jgi:nucleotide-binding universal stress UspA family protein
MPRFQRGRIIVPIDYSDASLRAVRTARTLAESPSDLTVVYALPNMDLIVPGQRWSGVLSHDELRARAVVRMDKWLVENGIDDVNHEVLIGDAGLEVSKFATDSDAHLIVLPSHGRHGLKRLLLGSVAERIIRHSECSVLVLKHRAADSTKLVSEAWLPRKKVVVPIDFSRSTPDTVWLALELVDSRTDVDVINVLPPLDYIYGELIMATSESDADRRGEQQQYLERFLFKLT